MRYEIKWSMLLSLRVPICLLSSVELYPSMFRCLFFNWQVYVVRSVEGIGIRFRQVLFGRDGRLGQRMFCPMIGMTIVC